MIKGFLVCFFIFSCVQVLPGLALEYFHTLEITNPKVSRHLMVAQENNGTNSISSVNLHRNSDSEEDAPKHYVVTAKTGQKGKGSNGGANVVHHPRPIKSAASTLESLSVFISTTYMCLISLLLVSSF